MAETGSGDKFKMVQDLMHEMVALWQRVKDLEDADRDNRLALENLRSSDARLRCIIEKLPTRFFFKDAGLRYILCSEAYARDWDLSTGGIIGKSDRDLFAADAADKLADVEFEVIRAGKTEAAEEDRLVAGREVTFLAIRKPVIDAAGNTLGLLCTLQDITEDRQQKAAQERRIHELEAALSERVSQVESLRGEMEARTSESRRKEEEAGRLRAELEAEILSGREDMDRMRNELQKEMNGRGQAEEALQRSVEESRQKESEFARLRAELEAEILSGREDMDRMRNELQKEMNERGQAIEALKRSVSHAQELLESVQKAAGNR